MSYGYSKSALKQRPSHIFQDLSLTPERTSSQMLILNYSRDNTYSGYESKSRNLRKLLKAKGTFE